MKTYAIVSAVLTIVGDCRIFSGREDALYPKNRVTDPKFVIACLYNTKKMKLWRKATQLHILRLHF